MIVGDVRKGEKELSVKENESCTLEATFCG